MTTIPTVFAADLTTEQQRVHDALISGPRGGVRGPFPVLLHVPEIAERVADLGQVIRYETALPARLRELAILVTARVLRCELEWHTHSVLGREAGVPPVVIEAIRTDAEPSFDDPNDRAVHEVVRQLLERHHVDGHTWQDALERLGTNGVIELVSTAGYFTMVASMINAFGLTHSSTPPPWEDQ